MWGACNFVPPWQSVVGFATPRGTNQSRLLEVLKNMPGSATVAARMTTLERDVFIGDLAMRPIFVVTAVALALWCSTRFVIGSTVQHDQILSNDFRAIFLFAALLIIPAGGLKAAFDVDLRAFLDVLADDFRQPLPGHDVVPFGAILPFASFVLEPFVGREAKLCNRGSAGCEFDIRVYANISNQNYLIYTFRHFATPLGFKRVLVNCSDQPLQSLRECRSQPAETICRAISH